MGSGAVAPLASGLEYTVAPVNLDSPARWLREVSASGAVPVLHDQGRWVPEASNIAVHLDTLYKQPMFAPLQAPRLGFALHAYLRAYLISPQPQTDGSAAELLQQLDEVEHHLMTAGPFLSGSCMGAADALLLPVIQHIAVVVPHFKNVSMLGDFPTIRAYLSRTSCEATVQSTDCGAAAIIGYWKHRGICDVSSTSSSQAVQGHAVHLLNRTDWGWSA
eukprot:jgi/Ulvmu1/12252/UM086_0045.1